MLRRVPVALSALGLLAAAPAGLSALTASSAASPSHPAAGSASSRPSAEHVPRSVHHAVLTERNGVPSHVVRHGSIHGHEAKVLVHDYDQLHRAPKGTYNCPNDTGLRKIAKFHANGHVWVATEDTCDFVSVKRDGHHLPTLHSDKAYRHALDNDLAQVRPSNENVPASVHTVDLSQHNETGGPPAEHRTVNGRQARTLVKDFDALAVEPAEAVHCDVKGGPTQTATFRTKAHTWVATQQTCTGVQVKRDGHHEPTLLPDHAWDHALSSDLS